MAKNFRLLSTALVAGALLALAIATLGATAACTQLTVVLNGGPVSFTVGDTIHIIGNVTQGSPPPLPAGVQVNLTVAGPGVPDVQTIEVPVEGYFGADYTFGNLSGNYTLTFQAYNPNDQACSPLLELEVNVAPLPPSTERFLVIEVDQPRFEIPTNVSFAIAGRVFIVDGYETELGPANDSLVQVTFFNPFQPDVPPSGRTDANGRFNITVPGRPAPKTYYLNVKARSDDLDLNAQPVLVTALVAPPPAPPTPPAPVGGQPLALNTPVLIAAAGLMAGGVGGYALIRRRTRGPPPGAN